MLKKIALFTFLIISSIHTLSAQMDADCVKAIRTGKFTYPEKEGEIEITRTPTQQIEVYNGGKSKLIMDITWKNDREYILTQQQAINAPGCLKTGDRIKVVVMGCEEKQYVYNYSSRDCGSGNGTLIRLKE